MNNREVANIVRLGPRVPAGRRAIGTMDGSIINIAVPDRVIEARSASTTTSSSSDATGSCGANPCEKPVSQSTFTLPIVLGIAIPVIGAAILFMILQRRHTRKQREEDANDRHASMDFGLGDVPRPGGAKTKRAPTAATEMSYGDEKPGLSKRQVSLDMSQHNNPYLLPPELQNSRESLHSLSRTMEQEDPYRPVAGYYTGDAHSIRSQSKKGSSIYTGSSMAPSRLQELGTADLLSNAQRMSRSSPPTAAFVPPARQNSLPQSNASMSPVELSANRDLPPYPVEPPQAHIPDGNVSPPPTQRGLPMNPRPGQLGPSAAVVGDVKDSSKRNTKDDLLNGNNYLVNMIQEREPSPPPVIRKPAPLKSLPSNPRPVRKESLASNGSDYGDAFKVTPPSPGRDQSRGQRYSMDVPPEEFAQAGLGAPGFDPKRLSMGFRPLPPNAATESDDPEVRANRIRSFYKEYFDDSKPAPQGQYYEDYDENYLGEAAYYDPDTNAFVMPSQPNQPYNEPITRRAMTPPPRGPRFQGPPGPRGRQGSMGAMSTISAGGMRGPRPGPRAYSSASGRMGPPAQQRRPMPPPAALSTLPTPSKLRDDSFAINPLDFAPPKTYRDRVAGRSESPLGERRPYSPAVPAYAPVASAFEELAPMPSPHMLRNSGTFTSLDFAPPKKFRDPDSTSDAGSIRSNRSGVSQRTQGAIRNGAYRVSKIPQDVVGTKDDFANALKPQWGMRTGM